MAKVSQNIDERIITSILVEDAELNSDKLPENDDVDKIINETLLKQEEVLKLNRIDRDQLRMIVQL